MCGVTVEDIDKRKDERLIFADIDRILALAVPDDKKLIIKIAASTCVQDYGNYAKWTHTWNGPPQASHPENDDRRQVGADLLRAHCSAKWGSSEQEN